MKIRKAKVSDLSNIMKMYTSCINGMIENDIDQWDESYPNKQIITMDIKAKTYFVVEKDGKIIAGINIDKNQDPTYLNIKWKDTENLFLVVHRLAVKQENWNEGIGKKLMLFAEKLVIKNELNSIRLDTYSNNPKAMIFYKNIGYHELGTINLKPDKEKYHCFEKIIK